MAAATGAGVEVQVVSGEVMSELAQTVTPQGLLAVCEFVDVPLDQLDRSTMRLAAMLANVRDPGNAGTVLRAADAAGADAVCSRTPRSTRTTASACGPARAACFTCRWWPGYGSPTRSARSSGPGCGSSPPTAGQAFTLDDPETRAALKAPTAWLFGNEAWGLPRDLLALADESVAVPIYGRAESLNLAAAAAVCLYASAAAQR